MAEGGQQNQQHQQNVFNITIALQAQQNQRELVQARSTEIRAGNIENIIIPQAAEQQAAQNIVEQVADNVQPDNIAEDVEALNLSPTNTQASQSGAIKKKGDLKVRNLQTKTDREPTQSNHPPPRTQIINPQPNQTTAVPRYTTAPSVINAPKISMLQKKSSELFDKSKYEEAVPIFEELATLQNHQDFYTILMMVECFIQLGRGNKAEKAIGNLRNILMTSSVTSADDVKDLAIDLISNSAYIRAIILLRIASDIYKARTRTPDDVINGIKLCVRKIHDATRPLIGAGGRSKIIGVDYGLEYMTEMLDGIRAIENADPVNKAIQEAWCLNYIGSNYNPAGEEEKSIKILKNGLEVLEKQFGSNASKYKIYGGLLHNIGVGYYVLQKYEEAESYYIKSIDAKQKASDYENEAEKQEWIELLKTELRKARAQLT
uniref:uncharacterized protein LOC120329733 n=1 Tax=Styela clava TaxID=7725 RepID=UPI00193A1A38|nr:uncharacterized protein LOC120329733 [Styela clava]